MRAARVERYGPPEVIEVVESPAPVAGAGQVLVRVHVAAVTSGDARIRGARFPAGFGPFVRLVFGLTRPRRRILGNTFAGIEPASAPAFIAAQLVAVGIAIAMIEVLWPDMGEVADRVVLPHDDAHPVSDI